METLQVTKIERAEALEAMNRSEIDMQIATAKKYPRDIMASINKVVALATVDENTAEECFYSLKRRGSDGDTFITGPSVRLAEIVAASWGNIRVAAQVVGNDGKFITARGTCIDLETNNAVSVEVQRRICDKYGKTYSEDMQVVTGNAAAAIAFRNAIFKVVPMSTFGSAIEAIKQKAAGQAENLPETIQKMLRYYASIGVTEDMVLFYLGISKRDDIDSEMIESLRGVKNAIKEGMTTARDSFINPYNEKGKSAEASAKGGAMKDRVTAAMKKQNQEQVLEDLPLGI